MYDSILYYRLLYPPLRGCISPSLIFFIPGVNETLRLNGMAEIRDDTDLMQRFLVNDKMPKSAVVVSVKEVYLHCAKALMRSELWSPNAQATVRPIPSLGEIIKAQSGDPNPAQSQVDMEENY